MIEHAPSSHPTPAPIRAFTFWLGEALYGLDIREVLSIEPDDETISPVPLDRPGMLRVLRHRDRPVTVFDLARRIGVRSGRDRCEENRRRLDRYETLCRDWTHGDGSTAPPVLDLELSPRERELLGEAMSALSVAVDDCRASRRSCRGLDAACSGVRHAVAQLRENLQGLARSVILFATTDGRQPAFALRIDELHQILEFAADELVLGRTEAGSIIRGYLIQEGQPDCLLLDATPLLADRVVADSTVTTA
ncbi:MAG: chemotaxis protein CheW [Planctomycetes bacterium]|nr:chemotaxis protein CheW [Planctomycetota bacterium]